MTLTFKKKSYIPASKFATLEHNCCFFRTQLSHLWNTTATYLEHNRHIFDDETGSAVAQFRMKIHKTENGGSIMGLLDLGLNLNTQLTLKPPTATHRKLLEGF